MITKDGRMYLCSKVLRIIVGGAAVLCFANLAGPLLAQSQWSGTAGGPIYYNGGNVGIGTTAPNAGLVISTSAYNAPVAYVSSSSSGGGFGIYNTNSNTASRNWGIVSNFQLYGDFAVVQSGAQGGNPFGANYVKLYIGPSGDVGIGTTWPQHLLQVAGTIGAEQVIVSATGADYVFDPHYHLAPLTEVAAYVERNHHLPGIPSADEMSKSGVSLGEMQTKLLTKIEELTLHMIQADERNNVLVQQNLELQKRIARLEASSVGSGRQEQKRDADH